MVAIRARLLGRFHVSIADNAIRFPTRKAESLFAHLLLNLHKPIARDKIVTMFWPDTIESRARRNLSTTLWRIRRAIGNGTSSDLRIQVGKDCVELQCDQLEVDVIEFKTLLESAADLSGKERLEVLKRAESIYIGDFLEGFTDEWCEEERRYERRLYVDLLKKLVSGNKGVGDYKTAIAFAQRAVALEPLDEEIHRELMLLYYLSRNRTQALAQYEILRRLLEDELGVQPSAPTTELQQYIQSRNEAPSMFSSGLLQDDPRHARIDQFTRISMVGRESHLALLTRLLEDSAGGNGGAVIVSGEAGVGKTKLVETLSTEAGLRGFVVLHGRCADLKDPPPYQLFIQALWPRLSAFERLGFGPSSPLANLISALAPNAIPGNRNQSRGDSGVFDQAIVTEALLGLLADTHDPRPTLLVLEDIHRADKPSSTLLVTLLGRMTRLKLFVMITTRIGEGAAVDELISALASEGALELGLERLSEKETTRLVRVALRSKNVASPVVDYLWQQTHGNPFFVLEFLKLLCAEGALIRDSVGHWSFKEAGPALRIAKLPLRVQVVIRKRIEILDSLSRKVLSLAALIGVDVEFELLRQLVGLSEEELVEATDRLLREQLLEEINGGFRFSHESIRAVALSLPSRARMRLLHLKTGRLKERATPGGTEDLSWHFEEAGDLERALTYAEASGDKARTVHANDDAVKWYTRALEMVKKLESAGLSMRFKRRLSLLVKRQEVLEILGDRSGQLKDIDSIYEIGCGFGDHPVQALALSLRANLFVRLNAAEKAIEAADKARQLFRMMNDIAGEARSCLTIGVAYSSLRRYHKAFGSIRSALFLFRKVRDRREGANALFHMGIVLTYESKYLEALKSLDQVEQLLRDSEDRRSIAYSFIQKVVIYRCLGKMKLSESLGLSSLTIFREIGDRVGEARVLTQLALTQVALGELRAAVHNGRKALGLACKARDIRAQVTILNNTGAGAYRCVGDFTRAKKNVAHAMALIAVAGDQESLAIYQDSMAAVLLDQGDYTAALHWSKLSWASCRSAEMGVGLRAEIRFRLGCAYLELKDRPQAIRYLQKALIDHTKCGEIPFQIRTMVALARAYLATGDVANALKYSRGASRFLHRVDGMEQVQIVHWTQFQVLKAIGARVAAGRVLQKAYSAVVQQASSLKGRMKARFLNEVRINREILAAADGLQQISSYRRVESLGSHETVRVDPTAGIHSPLSDMDLRSSLGRADSRSRGERIANRRRTILNLLRSDDNRISRVRQYAIASTLGVSIRTVRSDMAAVRKQRFLSKDVTA